MLFIQGTYFRFACQDTFSDLHVIYKSPCLCTCYLQDTFLDLHVMHMLFAVFRELFTCYFHALMPLDLKTVQALLYDYD